MLFPTYGIPMAIHPADGVFVAAPMSGNVHDLVDFNEVPSHDSLITEDKSGGNSTVAAPRCPR
jgi:hypothetical protein